MKPAEVKKLQARIAGRRADGDFQKRLERRLKEDSKVLDILAGIRPK